MILVLRRVRSAVMAVGLLVCLVLMVTVASGCQAAKPKQANTGPSAGSAGGAAGPPVGSNPPATTGGTKTVRGMTLSPRSFGADDFKEFPGLAAQMGGALSWAGDWNEIAGEKGGPAVTVSLAAGAKLTPVLELQFFSQSVGKLLRPLDTSTQRSYRDGAVAFVQKNKPRYLGLGIEVNVLYERSPSDFDSFVKFYDQMYDAVKAASPDTRVFTIFNLEKMKGLGGGLFGGANDPAKAQWALLDRFPKADLVAFTTYPGLIYKSPADIPADYYSEIQKHVTAKPIAFTEIGWHTATSPAGWESSEAEQAEFITRFFQLAAPVNPELEIWSFMFDQAVAVPFASMGLRRSTDGGAKAGWRAWIETK